MSDPFEEYDIFHDKGEVKRLVESVVQRKDPEVTIDRLRKIDFSYIFLLAKRGKVKEVGLTRDEINASVNWRRGTVDETLVKKIERAIDEFSLNVGISTIVPALASLSRRNFDAVKKLPE